MSNSQPPAGSTPSFDSVPVIDIEGADRDARRLQETADKIYDACTRVGFFYVAGHGLPADLVSRTYDLSRQFFDLPEARKKAVEINAINRGWIAEGQAKMTGAKLPDLKESFKIGLDLPLDDPDVLAGLPLAGPNVWPDDVPGMADTVYAYFEGVMGIGASILRATAVSLGLAEDFFAKRYAKPIARTGLLYYPDQDPTRGDDQFGVAPHTDYGCLTVLSQDSSGGLQVMNKAGQWVEAPPIPGTFVINVGDLLERWSNDRFTSTPHRVINRSGHARYSISHFYDPTYETVVDPRDAGLPAGMDSKYEPVLAGDYVLGRFDTTMAYRSKFKATA